MHSPPDEKQGKIRKVMGEMVVTVEIVVIVETTMEKMMARIDEERVVITNPNPRRGRGRIAVMTKARMTIQDQRAAGKEDETE